MPLKPLNIIRNISPCARKMRCVFSNKWYKKWRCIFVEGKENNFVLNKSGCLERENIGQNKNVGKKQLQKICRKGIFEKEF